LANAAIAASVFALPEIGHGTRSQESDRIRLSAVLVGRTTRDARGGHGDGDRRLDLDATPRRGDPLPKGCANLAELVVSVSAAGCCLFSR